MELSRLMGAAVLTKNLHTNIEYAHCSSQYNIDSEKKYYIIIDRKNFRQSYLHKIVHVILAHRQLRCCVRHFLRTLCKNGRKPTTGLHRITSEKRGASANATALTATADSRTFSHCIVHRTKARRLFGHLISMTQLYII